ncbi:MAG: hypothetical protein EA380_07275 [Phycisphaeraceae bacterium]|nr:MAG: hypothetical protein EA380_07275 [Phycisphaeraceae bacterium]
MSGIVRALTVFDDGFGSGPAIYAGGVFGQAGGNAANFIAKWNGASWSQLADGVNGVVRAMTVFENGFGNRLALYVGGEFTQADGSPANHIARWQECGRSFLCSNPPVGDINNDCVVDLNDFVILAANFGAGPGATFSQGDLNGDGFVNLNDFIILAGNFGSTGN